MPEKMPQTSMLPVPSRFQYVHGFLDMHQHRFICHLLRPIDFQHPLPHPPFKCYQMLSNAVYAMVDLAVIYLGQLKNLYVM